MENLSNLKENNENPKESARNRGNPKWTLREPSGILKETPTEILRKPWGTLGNPKDILNYLGKAWAPSQISSSF